MKSVDQVANGWNTLIKSLLQMYNKLLQLGYTSFEEETREESMFNFGGKTNSQPILMPSKLHDENTFYHAFINDLNACKEEIIIESPFISSPRMKKLYPVFERFIKRGVRVYAMTCDPREHDDSMEEQSEYEIQRFKRLRVQVLLCTGNRHRKLAILDRKIL